MFKFDLNEKIKFQKDSNSEILEDNIEIRRYFESDSERKISYTVKHRNNFFMSSEDNIKKLN
jgi:hypothetical protein